MLGQDVGEVDVPPTKYPREVARALLGPPKYALKQGFVVVGVVTMAVAAQSDW
jgi:hypothetical protein